MSDEATAAQFDSPGTMQPANAHLDSRIENRLTPQTGPLAVWEDEGGAAAKPAGRPAAVKRRAALEQPAP